MPDLPQDYFAAFGLPRKLSIDLQELDRKRLELSRQYHPDRFSTKPAPERQFATDMTSLVNDGYRVLRDRVRRAEYVLKADGMDVAEQRPKDVPQDLLEEVFELNMALEELCSGESSARPQIEAAGASFRNIMTEIDHDLETEFERFDLGDKGALARIRTILNRRRYIENLIAEVDRTLASPVG